MTEPGSVPDGRRLSGGDVTTVVQIGDTVRRTPGAWTPAVHALLGFLQSAGFDAAPRALGFDEEGREILTFVQGDPALIPLLPRYQTDSCLASLARLLRRFHDVSATFPNPEILPWRQPLEMMQDTEVICHNDLFPPNVIFRDGEPVALIDWDFAAPGSRLSDLASLAEQWVPLVGDARASRLGWQSPQRGRRLRLMADSYGLAAAQRSALIDMCEQRLRSGMAAKKRWARDGDEAIAALIKRGNLKIMQDTLDWLTQARESLQQYLL